jgi:hypothetical protein
MLSDHELERVCGGRARVDWLLTSMVGLTMAAGGLLLAGSIRDAKLMRELDQELDQRAKSRAQPAR